MPASNDSSSPVAIEAKIEFLKQPEAYAERPHRVEVIETHMAWVFLTEVHAYKLKKPVRYEFLDFSTLDARYRDCCEEIRLNRRLAQEVYIGLVALTLDPQGNFQLSGPGKPIDWLVKMRRLPRERMLDEAIKSGTVRESEVRHFASVLSRFYRDSPPVEMTPTVYLRRFEEDIRANERELERPSYGVPVELVRTNTEMQLAFLREFPELLGRRAEEHKIVEAHGDLRPEHICLEPKPVFIDCLEFKREFRLLDPVDELAFLAMECDRLGASLIGDLIFETYFKETHDQCSESLLFLYKGYRACLRAKIAIWHMKDPKTSESGKWLNKAQDYLRWAERYGHKIN